jgi:hypothetical protein
MINKIEYANGYIEIYSSHYFGYNYKQKRGQVFMTQSVSEIKRKMDLK